MTISRAVLAGLAALLLCGAGEPPPPPPEIAAYVKDGRFEPDDHAWMRGAFADATPEQKALLDAATDWGARCRKARHEAALRELAELGIAAPALDEMPFDCGVALAHVDYGRPYAEFEAALREARPIAATYIAAARLAQERATGNAASLGEALTARTIGEQMLRLAFGWGREPLTDVPELSPDGLAMLRSLLIAATNRADAANTAWLKAQVAENGWPKISQVGEKGSGAAWLLTQHADLDPVFQARALRLMEPLVGQGEVSKQNYAYLYDRIMLKLTGRQRYGTQWDQCEAGRRKLRPVEDESRLADLRREMGLDPIEDYARAMDQMFGPCPAG
jgi:hypothetical protein